MASGSRGPTTCPAMDARRRRFRFPGSECSLDCTICSDVAGSPIESRSASGCATPAPLDPDMCQPLIPQQLRDTLAQQRRPHVCVSPADSPKSDTTINPNVAPIISSPESKPATTVPPSQQPLNCCTDPSDSYELPTGWRQVTLPGGVTYYWHVATGSTSWERPTISAAHCSNAVHGVLEAQCSGKSHHPSVCPRLNPFAYADWWGDLEFFTWRPSDHSYWCKLCGKVACDDHCRTPKHQGRLQPYFCNWLRSSTIPQGGVFRGGDRQSGNVALPEAACPAHDSADTRPLARHHTQACVQPGLTSLMHLEVRIPEWWGSVEFFVWEPEVMSHFCLLCWKRADDSHCSCQRHKYRLCAPAYYYERNKQLYFEQRAMLSQR